MRPRDGVGKVWSLQEPSASTGEFFLSSAPKEQGLGMEEASGEGRGGGEGTIEFHPPRPPFTVWAVVLWQEGWGTILA